MAHVIKNFRKPLKYTRFDEAKNKLGNALMPVIIAESYFSNRYDSLLTALAHGHRRAVRTC